jgi:hypothetical protein
VSLSISLEEKDVLFIGFLIMIRDRTHNLVEYDMAAGWMARPGAAWNKRGNLSFEDVLMTDPTPLDFYKELKDLHNDWVETLPEEVLQQYRERQMTHIVLGEQ